MTKEFERVLSDAELISATFKAEVEGTMGELRAVEQAVLAKLAEQEPVAWRITAKRFCGDFTKDKETAQYWLETEPANVTPLYAHPSPSNVSDKTACVSENAESDMQRHLEYIKRYQKWRRGEDKTMSEAGLEPKQIGESLDWLVCFVENHTEEARVMASPECLELIPKTGAPRRDGYGWDDESTPSNKVIIQLMAKYHLQMLLGSDFEKVMDFGRDAFNYAIGEYVNMRGEKVGGDHIADIRKKVPEGWQLVPKEPTEEMHHAARDWSVEKYGKAIGFESSHGCYQAMLAAAPKHKGSSDD